MDTGSSWSPAGFPAGDLTLTLLCPGCASRPIVTFPLLSDWRDRRRLALLQATYPSTPCPSCGVAVTVDCPAIVLRPGDPIAVLFSVPDAAPEYLDAFREALQRHAADAAGVVAGPVANTDRELLGLVAHRYSGFQILGLDGPAQQWADDEAVGGWLAAMRRLHEWPDLVAAVNGFLTTRDESDGIAWFAQHPELADAVWEPVIRWIGSRTATAQDSTEGVAAVRGRMRHLGRLRMSAPGMDPTAPSAVHAYDLLERLTSLQSAAHRSADDVAAGIAVGREFIDHATSAYGAEHPLTITAINDTAALMLDDARDPAATVSEARGMLARLRDVAIRVNSPAVADATTNLALAHLRIDRIADADLAEAAIALLEDALHLHEVYYPDEPFRALSAVSNLASLVRSRLTGDPAGNTERAIDLFTRARHLDGGRRLTVPDRITLHANLLSALYARAEQDPSLEHDREVVDAMTDVADELAALADQHPVRLRSLTNLGSVALGLLYRQSPAVPADVVERALGWLQDAHRNSRDLAPDDAVRVLATTTLAALHFRLGGQDNVALARTLLTECTEALAVSQATRLHHTAFENLARLHLAVGDWDAAVAVFEAACRHADEVIDRAENAATRLAHVAAAGDLYQRLALLHAHRQDARAAIHTVERSRARWRERTVGRFDPQELDRSIAARLRRGTALLYVGTCALGSYGVVLVPGQGAGAWSATVDSADVAPILTRLQTACSIEKVAELLDQVSSLLSDGLLDQAHRIFSTVNVRRVAIIASGALAGLPIGALPCPDESLSDICTVEYLVGARTGPTPPAGSAPPRATPDAVAVVNPTRDLQFAASELQSIQRYAPATATPPEGAGIRGWLLGRLRTATHLHLACHGRYDPADPFSSRFVLGENLSVTVADLAELDTSQLALVVASCCHSAVIDQRGADELVGLAHALIAAGAQSAVATLWEIDDAGTSLIIARFYDELRRGTPPAAALAQAQRHIRDATMQSLAPWVDPANNASWIPDQLRRELRALAHHPDLRDPASRPFAHPAHWAALVYIGT